MAEAHGKGTMSKADTALPRVLDAVVAAYPGVTHRQLLALSRLHDPVPEARMIAMYAHHRVSRCTKSKTAQMFNRAPGTMTHALKTVDARRDGDRLFAARLYSVLARLGEAPEAAARRA